MSSYFSHFPIITYLKKEVRDITRRTEFRNKNLKDPLLFLPYTVKEGEKPETVAYYYYGSVDYTWLVLMANEMLDPYSDWALDTDDFHKYLAAKYKEDAGSAQLWDVLAWTQNENITDNIVFYYREEENGETVRVSPDTFTPASAIEGGWTVMRVYDYETMLNEEKRNIQLVDEAYKDQIFSEFKRKIVK